MSLLWPVEGDEPLEAKQRDEDGAGPHRLPEVGRLVDVRSPQLGQEDVEDVDEEEHVACNTEQAGQVGDPLHPAVVRRLGPAHRVPVVQPDGGVHDSRHHGTSWEKHRSEVCLVLVDGEWDNDMSWRLETGSPSYCCAEWFREINLSSILKGQHWHWHWHCIPRINSFVKNEASHFLTTLLYKKFFWGEPIKTKLPQATPTMTGSLCCSSNVLDRSR